MTDPLLPSLAFFQKSHLSRFSDKADLALETVLSGVSQEQLAVTSIPFGAGHLQELVDGRYDLALYQGLYPIGIRDFTVNCEFSIASKLSNALSLECILSGGSDLNLCGAEFTSTVMPRAYLSSYKDGGRQTRLYHESDQVKGVGLWFPPELLVDSFGLAMASLPESVASVLTLQTEQTISMVLDSKTCRAMSDLLEMPYTGLAAAQFRNAKMTEILCYIIDQLKSPLPESATEQPLSRHKTNALNGVIQILNNNLVQTHNLDTLAQQVGVSRSALTSLFKSSFGLSISQYLLKKRMEAAKELLRDGKMSVLEVAMAVGYEDQSAFGRAYKRFHGHPPKDDKISA